VLSGLTLFAGLAVLLISVAEAGDSPGVRRETPSGLPVPRYVSLKFGEVNARAGPGDDYRLLWTYRARGLPLQVIAETSNWRRVCDPEGAVAWVHQRTVDTRRTVMRVRPDPAPIRRRPDARAGVVAELAGRTVASLDMCRDGWCRVAAGGVKGWTPAAGLWGVDQRQQCKPKLPSPRRRPAGG
jgi:SH3-like domain-containing protein